MGLVRDECLIPTYDAPELGYIKESSNQQYVPDVFFKVNPYNMLLEFLHLHDLIIYFTVKQVQILSIISAS